MSWKTYTIEKGHHTSGTNWPRLHVTTFPRKWEWSVSFGDGCLYDMDWPDRADINKLVGVSLWSHLRNSYRFGWRAAGDFVEILPYVTVDGADNRLTAAPLGTVRPGEIHKLSIELGRGSTILTLDDDAAYGCVNPRERRGVSAGYHLHPYFGGNRVAPHTMHIRLLQW